MTDDVKYYYPTSVLITSRDIITLWVVRMVLTGLANMDDQPEPILQRDFPGVTEVKLRTEL